MTSRTKYILVIAGIGAGVIWLFSRRRKESDDYDYAAFYPEIKANYDAAGGNGILAVCPPPTPEETNRPTGIFGVMNPFY